MKFLKLEILNLASLDKMGGEVINFEEGALGESTIFSIVGPTGSGKSTILDAICLALYNRAPRYPRQAGGKDRIEVYGDKDNVEANRLSPTDGRNILSRGKKECYSKLTFLANNGCIYRAEWSVRFKTRKYEDVITSLYKIIKKDGKQEEEVADWKDLPKIIGLDYDQFLRTVLIAQGSFANFLTAKVDERYALLEKLVGCEEIYTRIAEEIKQKKDASIAVYNEIKSNFEAYEKDDLTQEQLDDLKQHIKELKEAEEKLNQELEQVNKALVWYADEEKFQLNIHKYKIAQDEAKAALEGMKNLSDRLALHDATLQAVDYYKEKKSKDEALRQIAEDLKKLSEELVQKEEAIVAEEKELQDLEEKAKEAACILSQKQPVINKARITKTQWEAEKKIESEKEELLVKAQNDLQGARNKVKANKDAVKANQESLNKLQAQFEALKESVEKRKDELKEMVEKATEAYEQKRKQLEGKNLEELQLAKEQARIGLQDLKEAIRVLHDLKEQEQKKCTHEQRIHELTERNKSIDEELGKLTIETLFKELETCRKTHTLLTSERWSEHRLSLTDGKPCPLCGSEHHPFQQEEVFEPVVTELETLIKVKELEYNAQTECEKKLHLELGNNNGELKTLKESLEILYRQLEKSRFEWNPIAEKYPDWKADEGSLKTLEEPMKDACQQAEASLKAYNTLHGDVEKLRIRKEKEENIQKDYERTSESDLKKLENQRAEASIALATEQGKTENLEIQCKEKEEDLNKAIEEQVKAQESVRQKLEELKRLIGEEELDALEKKLSDNKAKADEAVNSKNKQITQLKEQLANIVGKKQAKNTQHQQDKEAMEEKVQQLTDWLSVYNADESHVRKLVLEDIMELGDATDNWEGIRKEKDKKIQAYTSAETTLRNEEKAHFDHQQSKPAEEKAALETKKQELKDKDRSELIASEAKLQRYQKAREAMGAIYEQKQQAESVMKDWTGISEAIGGSDGKLLRKIAQCYTLRFLIEHANAEIRKFNQRYELVQVKNSLGIRVIDHDRADDIRDTTSLSGGETFIVSLGLALGLSALSSRNISFENLFIDEGFGTLDPGALSTVIDSLAMLQSSQGKKVGVISHTDTMSERITTQIRIVKNGNSGSSHIEVYP